MQSLNRMQFTTPTPIQAAAIPVALKGRDILGSAQTGTGKTGAFGIPLIARLMEDEYAMGLVMAPTRELAAQVMASLQQMIPVPNIKCALLIGGEPMPKQFRQLQQKPRLIIGTPGRINDHLERGTLKLNKAKFLVLDETDRMLDMGFGVQIDTILQHVPAEGRQTMLFSATLPPEIVKLSSRYLNNPERIAVGSTSAPAAKIKQELIQTSESDKYQQLLVQVGQRNGSIIVFVKTKYGADRLADRLTRAEHQATAIHGDLKQSRRDRVIQDFRNRKHRILVATDVAARGLDIPHIEHVINYDMPQVPEDYIHRIGRTARAGAEGEAVNLLTPADGVKWRAIQRLLNPEERMPAHIDEGGGKKRSGGNSFGGKKRFGGDKSAGAKPWQKKPFFKKDGEERPRKQWDPAQPASDRADRSDRPQQQHGERTERKSWGDKPVWKKDGKPQGERKQWGDKPQGERKSWGDKPQGERKQWSDKPRTEQRAGEARKSWGDKPAWKKDGKPQGERKQWSGKPQGERKSWGDKPRTQADGAPQKKRHYGNRMQKRASA